MTISRRRFLLAATAAPATFLRQSGAAARKPVTVDGKRVRTVDMHTHGYVPEVWPVVKDRREAEGENAAAQAAGPMALSARTIEARLAEMDRQGIDMQVVSLQSSQRHYWAEPELARRIVKTQNEKLAALCAAHPQRFVAMGGVALQHPDLAAEQLDDAVSSLRLRGVTIAPTVNGDEISYSKFDPFWERAAALGIVVLVHPTGFPEAGARLTGAGWLGNTVGNPLDTTVALSHMIFDGFLDRFPGVRILAAHGGGYLPSYIGRSDKCNSWNPDCQKMERKPSEYLRGPQLHFDALVYGAENIRHLVATVGASQVVIGTDFAYDMASRTPVGDILSVPGLTPEEQAAILGGNAARLLKLPVV